MYHFSNILLLALFLLLNSNVQAQIQELTRLSDIIIEGKVVSCESKWNDEQNLILTENKILIKSVFKGQIKDSLIVVTTTGGNINNNWHFKTHEINTNVGDEGYFFLTPIYSTNSNLFSDQRHGFIEIHGSLRKFISAFGLKLSINELEEQIIQETKFPKLNFKKYQEIFSIQAFSDMDTCDILPQTRNINSIVFTFDSVRYTSDLQYLEFDIMAKVNTPGLKFGRGDLFISYDKVFGENVVSKGSVDITKGEILDNSLYDLQYDDYSKNSIIINADSEFGSNEMFTFSSKAAELLHVKVKIEDFSQIGTISFDNIDISGTVYYWCQGSYNLFDQVNLGTPIISVESIKPIGLIYTFGNGHNINNNTQFKVDIMAEATNATQYSGGTVEVSYNTDAFGSNVITTGNVNFQRGELIADESVYTSHFIQDITTSDNVIQIYTFSDPAITTGRTILGSSKMKLGTLTFDIENCEAEKDIVFNQLGTVNQGNHIHFTGNNPLPNEDYDPVIAIDTEVGEVCGCTSPEITSFEGPDANNPHRIPAGMGEILTITGSNFLSRDVDSKIYFRNGDDGGISLSEAGPADIISWTDNEIQVIVPGTDKDPGFEKPPCSGNFEVHNRCGDDKSPTELEIPYSILSIRNLFSEKIAMQDNFCIGFSSSIPVWARNTFRNAMDAWCSRINMNIKVDYVSNSTKSEAAIDGVSLVSNESVSSGGGIAGLTICNDNCLPVATNFYIQQCPGENNMFRELDIKISDQALNGSVQALFNVLVHEIGHALMLNHSDNVGITLDEEARYIMYFDQTNLNFNGGSRSIKDDDEEGAEKLFSNSIEAIQGCGGSPITSGNCNSSCITTSIKESIFIQNINLFPNPSDGVFSLVSQEYNLENAILTIYTLDGKIVRTEKMESNTFQLLNENKLNSGSYIVEIQDGNLGYWATKIIVK